MRLSAVSRFLSELPFGHFQHYLSWHGKHLSHLKATCNLTVSRNPSSNQPSCLSSGTSQSMPSTFREEDAALMSFQKLLLFLFFAGSCLNNLKKNPKQTTNPFPLQKNNTLKTQTKTGKKKNKTSPPPSGCFPFRFGLGLPPLRWRSFGRPCNQQRSYRPVIGGLVGLGAVFFGGDLVDGRWPCWDMFIFIKTKKTSLIVEWRWPCEVFLNIVDCRCSFFLFLIVYEHVK